MKNINHVIDIVGQSQHHMPALLSLLAGLFSVKKDPFLSIGEENPGDNIPATLMESLRR